MSLKAIWYFAPPSSPFGYGIVTKEICTRLQNDGHNITIASRYDVGAPHMDGALKIFTGVDSNVVKIVNDTEKYDYVFYCLNEEQKYSVPFDNWVACAAIDFEYLHKDLAEGTKKSKAQFCVSEHNKREFEKFGFKPYYCPWGVDTKLFKPSSDFFKSGIRENMGWGDKTFVIGTVGQNLPNDRKNNINLLKAFKVFSDRHPDSVLYMHTSAYSAFPLQQMALAGGINSKVFFPDQKFYHMYAFPYEKMVEVYNSFNVCCIPSKGESFCLPLMEAQACGVPVITTDTTCGREMTKSGWLIPVDDDDYEYLNFGTWHAVVRPSKIVAQLENAYSAWKQNSIEMSYGPKARAGALEYDWDHVYDRYWRPFLKDLEAKKNAGL